ncbi:hypothetical protein PHET_07569 [Paragonimus heterotremus]|uniref:Essential MCU regulator, mitochondrial n=1 Tax=Paragonimus heterotremus TaxID=100268 RepID=A0A8J4WGK8_9TREM|nr:hypothetical protein PHET_07569 [Paragonimus heterotremus]
MNRAAPLLSPFLSRFILRTLRSNIYAHPGAYRNSGAVCSRPEIMSFGVLRSLAISIPFICLGAFVSREGAAILEELDIFVPDDED